MKTMYEFTEEVGDTSFVSVRGGGTRWGLGGPLTEGTNEVEAPKGVILSLIHISEPTRPY